MRRARKLLSACSKITNTPTVIISQLSAIVIDVLVLFCILSNLFIKGYTRADEASNLSIISMIGVFLCIRSIYTVFFEDKRQGTKNSLKALTVHLPINKKDFILAQYLENIYLFLPAFILMTVLIFLNIAQIHTSWYSCLLGVMNILFCITYCLISLEKGLLIHYYVDPRIREIIYIAGAFIWLGINYLLEHDNKDVLWQILSINDSTQTIKLINKLGQGIGFICLILAFIVGYLLGVTLPVVLERGK